MKSQVTYAGVALTLACIGCSVDVPTAPPSQQPARMLPHTSEVLGTNLAPMTDWSSELPTADLFLLARPWESGTEQLFGDDRGLDLDDQGFVRSLEDGQVARTLLLSDGAHYPIGTYVFRYEGEGTLEFSYSRKSERVTSDGSGRHELHVDRNDGDFTVTIFATNQENYLRNMHMILPGGVCDDRRSACDENNPCVEGACTPLEQVYSEQIFYPRYLESLASYDVLRFMDWMQTNGSPQQQYSDRPTPDDANWNRRGVPVETMIELANRAERAPWFCMPHRADDGYVESFARYVHDHLDPALKVYIEYSNEVWNDGFEQADYARQEGLRAGLGDSEFAGQMQFYARRATEVHKIWEAVFGADAPRLVRVLGTEADNDWVSSTMLGFEDVKEHSDALAIAPYFGASYGDPERVAEVERMSLDQLMTQLKQNDVPGVIDDVTRQAAVARQYQLSLVAYEGGQHLVGVDGAENSDALNTLFDAANRDPRMKELYASYLRGFRNAGGGVFVHFTSCAMLSKFGRWGAREWLDQPRQSAPKLAAILEYKEAFPNGW